MFETLRSYVLAALDYFGLTVPPNITETAAGAPDLKTTLVEYLEKNSIALGPMLHTHGVIHKITVGTAEAVAAAILATSKKYGIKVSLLTSFVEQESKGDPDAENPNAQLSKPGETADELFSHTDFGPVQDDGSTLKGMPENKGKTDAEMEAEAKSPAWAMDHLGSTLMTNAANLRILCESDPTLLRNVPNGDVRIPLANTWNAGLTGTIDELKKPEPNLTYGEQVVKRADALAATLDIAS